MTAHESRRRKTLITNPNKHAALINTQNPKTNIKRRKKERRTLLTFLDKKAMYFSPTTIELSETLDEQMKKTLRKGQKGHRKKKDGGIIRAGPHIETILARGQRGKTVK